MFNGRYGMDELGRFMLIAAAVLFVLDLFLHIRIMWVAAVILLILVYSRAFSRFYDKRRAENMKYLEMKSRFTSGKIGGSGGFSRCGRKSPAARRSGGIGGEPCRFHPGRKKAAGRSAVSAGFLPG